MYIARRVLNWLICRLLLRRYYYETTEWCRGWHTYLWKSAIYRRYRYAFKFVTRIHLGHDCYFYSPFEGQPPHFCDIIEHIGGFANNFQYAEELPRTDPGRWGYTGPSPLNQDLGHCASGYRVRLNIGEHYQECIAIGHENGLEVFLLGAGVFIGLQAASYSLNKIIEYIYERIELWWKSSDSASKNKPIIEEIAVRTKHWEITIDKSFTRGERRKLFKHLERTLFPPKTIEHLVKNMTDKDLALKIVTMSRKVVRKRKKKDQR